MRHAPPRSFLRVASACSALLICVADARPAAAGIFLGAEFDGGAGVDFTAGTRAGYGALGALGYRIGFGPVYLQPEAEGGYMSFPGAAIPVHAGRVLGGFHFGLGGKVQPQLFGHAGVGWLASTVDGPALDVGLAVSFKLVPLFLFGAQTAYNVILIEGQGAATKWLTFGVHVGVEL